MKSISKKLFAFAMVLLTVLTVLTPVLPNLTAQAAKEVYVPGFPLPLTEKNKKYGANVLGLYTKDFAKKQGLKTQHHPTGIFSYIITKDVIKHKSKNKLYLKEVA